MKRLWKANCNCQMPFRDFTKGETVELDDDAVTPRVKALFTCLTPEQEKQEKENGKIDPDYKVMVERLKAAKIPMKKNISKAEVKALFDQFLAEGATAGAISGESEGDKPKEDKPTEDNPDKGEADGK